MHRPSASQFNFTIVDETEDWIVVDKPAPLQIHPSKPTDAGLTLWDGLRAMLSFEIINGGQVSLINRLDRETSGVVLVAKNAETARRFGKAMMRRQCAKTYQAIVRGWPEWETRILDAPILRAGDVMDSHVWVKQIVHEAGAACTTGFRVLRRFERNVGGERLPFALMEAKPHTGRMHQIRVHLEHLGFPVVGDKIYGGDESCYLEFIKTGWTSALQLKLLLPRQALHSLRMEVEDAQGNLVWEAPLAKELREFAGVGDLAKEPSLGMMGVGMYPNPLQELIDFFEHLSEQERRENLLLMAEQAEKQEPRDGEKFDLEDVRKDEECTDTVGVFLRADDDGHVHFAVTLGPKVQTLTKAMATILCRGLNGAMLQEVLDVPADFVPRIIGAELVRLRSQTVYYVLNRMKAVVKLYLDDHR